MTQIEIGFSFVLMPVPVVLILDVGVDGSS